MNTGASQVLQGLRIDVHTLHEGAVILYLDGRVDLFTAPRLQTALSGVVGQGCRKILINMSEVSYIDCPGLSAIIHAHKRLVAGSGTLRVTSPSAVVQQIIVNTGLDRLLDVFPDEQETTVGAEASAGLEDEAAAIHPEGEWGLLWRTLYPTRAGGSVIGN